MVTVTSNEVVYPIVSPRVGFGAATGMFDDVMFNSDLLYRPITECSWIEHIIHEEACDEDAAAEDELIERVIITKPCIEVFVNSLGGTGLLEGAKETGKGTVDNPYINLNSVTNGCIYKYYTAHCCDFPMLKVNVSGTVDYGVTFARHYRKMLLDFSGATVKAHQITPEGETNRGFFYGVLGVTFRNLEIEHIKDGSAAIEFGPYALPSIDQDKVVFNDCLLSVDLYSGNDTWGGFFTYSNVGGRIPVVIDNCNITYFNLSQASGGYDFFRSDSVSHIVGVSAKEIDISIGKSSKQENTFLNISFLQAGYVENCIVSGECQSPASPGSVVDIDCVTSYCAKHCSVSVNAPYIYGISAIWKAHSCNVTITDVSEANNLSITGVIGDAGAFNCSVSIKNASSVYEGWVHGVMTTVEAGNCHVSIENISATASVYLGQRVLGISTSYYGGYVKKSSVTLKDIHLNRSHYDYGYGGNVFGLSGGLRFASEGEAYTTAANNCDVTIVDCQGTYLTGIVGSAENVTVGISCEGVTGKACHAVRGILGGVVGNAAVSIKNVKCDSASGVTASVASDVDINMSISGYDGMYSNGVSGTITANDCIRCNAVIHSAYGHDLRPASAINAIDCFFAGSVISTKYGWYSVRGMDTYVTGFYENVTVVASDTGYYDDYGRYYNHGYGCYADKCVVPEGISASGSECNYYTGRWGASSFRCCD